jgi:hypothetical protein
MLKIDWLLNVIIVILNWISLLVVLADPHTALYILNILFLLVIQ